MGENDRPGIVRSLLLAGGPLLGTAIFLAAPLEVPGRATAGLAGWMALWWLTEVVPLWATALLPLVELPLAGAAPVTGAIRPYLHPLIFLFMGGFILALAMERWVESVPVLSRCWPVLVHQVLFEQYPSNDTPSCNATICLIFTV